MQSEGAGGCCGSKASTPPPLPVRRVAVIPLLPTPTVARAGVPSLGVLVIGAPDPEDDDASQPPPAALATAARRAASLLARRAAAAAAAAAAAGARNAFDAIPSPLALMDAGEPGWPLLLANTAWGRALGAVSAPRTPLWSLLRVVGGNNATTSDAAVVAASRARGAEAVGAAFGTAVAKGAPFSARVAPARGSGGAIDALFLPRPPASVRGDDDLPPTSPPPSRCRLGPPKLRVGPAAVTVLLTRPADTAPGSLAAVLDAMPAPGR